MKRTPKPVLVLVTAPDAEVARRLARMALETRLIACANLLPKLESHYWWQGRIESSQEVLMLLKTTRPCLRALQAQVLANHPYDTAEFVVLPLVDGSPRYLDWIVASVTPPRTPASKVIDRGSP